MRENTALYSIKFYRNAQGKQPVKEYLTELAEKTDKESRIKLSKIDYYMQVLREYGTRAGEPFVKHIEGDIWELRPLNDRFFFFRWQKNIYIILHHVVKKKQKTPKYEIEQVKRIMRDFINRSD